MITLDKITKKLGARVLFEDVTMTFNPGHRYGLTGPNGAGKSTLLKILMGVEEATSGTVSLPKKVGFLKQSISEFKDKKLIDAVLMGNKRLWAAIEEQNVLYEQEMTDEVGMRLGKLEEIIAEEDGYTAESEAEVLLSGMGIPDDSFQKKMGEVPLDHQFRVLLCQAIFGKPEALLLDEPTNHLDLDSIGWLETFLHEYSGTLIVVSHDRHFLNTVCTDIADIDYETVIIYPGNYDTMIVAKSDIRARTEADNKSKDKKVAQLKEFVAKFGAGTRASQVQSRIREIEKLQPAELKKSNIQRPYIKFIDPSPSGQVAFKVTGISKSYDSHDVIKNFSLEIHRGDKIGVIGNNGRGKTTLLKLLAGITPPDFGTITPGHNLSLGYFPQNHSDLVDKKMTINLVNWIRTRKSDIHEQDIRSALGKLLFSGDEALKEISKLSGGETARLIISSLIINTHNTLILDEPNNHLDLEAVSALGAGLKQFPGTVIVASHDRDLISSVATKIISIEERRIVVFDGTLDEFFNQQN
ncbi:MAG: ABC-F family ATP-binding cassette domain-containing protein [Chlamydiae bacterium]|nr:ABC-F family ATP-binding cassette domain-containing protein [Chlamydiota bacterium]